MIIQTNKKDIGWGKQQTLPEILIILIMITPDYKLNNRYWNLSRSYS